MNKRRSIKNYLFPFFTLCVYLFLYLPIFVLIIFSFNKSKLLTQWDGFSLNWYYELWHDAVIWNAFKNSVIVAVSAVALSVTMGVGLVYGLGKRLDKYFALFYGSVIIPEIVLGVGLLTIFSGLSIPLGFTTLIAGHTLLGLGFVIPIVHVRFMEIRQHITEASLDLGATRLQTFFYIILPLLRPALISAALLVLIISFDDFLISFFCAGASTQTLSLYIFAMIRTGISPVVNALSSCILIGSSLAVYLLSRLKIRPLRELT